MSRITWTPSKQTTHLDGISSAKNVKRQVNRLLRLLYLFFNMLFIIFIICISQRSKKRDEMSELAQKVQNAQPTTTVVVEEAAPPAQVQVPALQPWDKLPAFNPKSIFKLRSPDEAQRLDQEKVDEIVAATVAWTFEYHIKYQSLLVLVVKCPVRFFLSTYGFETFSLLWY